MGPGERGQREGDERNRGRLAHVRVRVLESMSQWVDDGGDHRGERNGGHGSKSESSDEGIAVLRVLWVGREEADGASGRASFELGEKRRTHDEK